MASFCWRDHEGSVVPEIVLLLAGLGFWLVYFQVVDILSLPLRLAQSEVIGQESSQLGGY